MAVIPTGAIYKALIFDGESSRNYGVYITGEAVYNSPERDVEMIKIPGRNGEFALDNGRFQNIEVTYPAGIFADSETDFAAAISDFRNFLASRVGYCRLEDEYNPNEYRMAVYKSGLNVDPAKLEAGEFDITFDCKPQRWLKDGESAVTIGEWGETETASGEIVSVDNPNGVLAVKSLEVDLEPIQSLNGYDKPWVGGAGKNKADISSAEVGTAWNGASNSARARLIIPCKASTTYTLSVNGTNNLDGINGAYSASIPASSITIALSGTSVTFTTASDSKYITVGFNKSGITQNDLDALKLQVEEGSAKTAYEPYENICPISGHTSVDVIVSPTTSASDGTTYTTALGRTVYGGNLEQISGVLTDGRYYYEPLSSTAWQLYDNGTLIGKSFSQLNLPKPYIKEVGSVEENILSSHFVKMSQSDATDNANGVAISQWNGNEFIYFSASAFGGSLDTFKAYLDAQRANGTPVQVVYELATPQTYQLTAQQISLLTGDNNIWSDGAITLEYGQNPSVLFNPTPFESSPLLETAGSGSIQFNGYEIDFEGVPIGEVVVCPDAYTSSSSNPATLSVPLDTSLLNEGDLIYPATKGFRINAQFAVSNARYKFTSASVTSTTNVLDASANISAKKTSLYCYLWPDFGNGFAYGTAETITCLASYNYAVDGGTLYTEQVQVTIAYDGADTITVTVSRTGTVDSKAQRSFNGINHAVIYGDSSKPNNDPIFIDCDLGEAYTNEGGVYRSLNQYIDLGSELPTLGIGANEVTFDNTITELKVTPRWWKV